MICNLRRFLTSIPIQIPVVLNLVTFSQRRVIPNIIIFRDTSRIRSKQNSNPRYFPSGFSRIWDLKKSRPEVTSVNNCLTPHKLYRVTVVEACGWHSRGRAFVKSGKFKGSQIPTYSNPCLFQTYRKTTLRAFMTQIL